MFLRVINYYLMQNIAKSVLYLVPFYLPYCKLEITEFKSVELFCSGSRFSFWFPNASTWLSHLFIAHILYNSAVEITSLWCWLHRSFIPSSLECFVLVFDCLILWACACSSVILSFFYCNAEKLVHYQLLVHDSLPPQLHSFLHCLLCS